ncbi:2Fe-2S iron-sulfur cluster-binding protein [Nonlabens sp.]|uniref:2Fe-2S iron-sulfur cluster-binding protein n=1 Tax=Nonlabens sp. TaxID=1888209 RepID=UPI003F6A4BCC
MNFHKLTIEQVTKVTSQAIEIRFEIPQDLVSSFNYQSGQYLTLKATINDNEVRRAYSLSSAPHENHWSVVIKAVENGVFSNYAMTLRAGDTLEVAAPEGLFTHETSSAQTYLGIAAGSGITPIISIIKTVLETEPESKFALIYGNQSVSQTIYFEQLNDLKDQYSDRFEVRYSFSREERDGELFGRVSKGNLNFFLKQDCGDYAFAKAYLCGPEEMIHMATDNLVEKGILNKENILFELFTTKENEIEITEDSHLTEVTVILDDEETVFTMKRSDNLLDVMLKNEIDAPYSCQGGICSSCICQIEEGAAQMAKNAILTDSEVAEGLSLACQAYPTSAKVKVNFDEV